MKITNESIAEALGWQDIKSWGGRGIRWIHPQRGAYESLPRFTVDLNAMVGAVEGLGLSWIIANGGFIGKKKNEPWATVGTSEMEKHAIGETPCLALAAATLAYLKERK